MKPLQPSKVQDARVQLMHGKSCRNVAKSLGISVSSVVRIRNNNKKNIPAPKIGAPAKLSNKTKRVLAQKFVVGKFDTLGDGQKHVKLVEGVDVAKQSILNYLKQQGLSTFIKQKVPDLTGNQIHKRYEFAKAHLKWTVEDWKNVMFSDETVISRVGSYGRKFYFKKKEDKTIRPHQCKNIKQGGGGKMMIWGCITYYGLGDACWIPGKVDSYAYINVLKDYVFASRDFYSISRNKFQFQQDNARIHTSKLTMDYIKKSKINVMEWPANSPDLNPIETVWAYLKFKLDQYTTKPNSMDELWDRVQDVWNNIPVEFLKHLYESMPGRMHELYKNKGGHISY